MIAALLGPVPDIVTVSLAGLVAGAATMLLFKRLSPQEELKALKVDAARARKKMQSYDGDDFSVMWGLTKKSLAAQFTQLRVMFVPTMISALPIIVLMAVFETLLEGVTVLAVGPDWLHSWHAPFLVALTISAVAVKIAFRIE